MYSSKIPLIDCADWLELQEAKTSDKGMVPNISSKQFMTLGNTRTMDFVSSRQDGRASQATRLHTHASERFYNIIKVNQFVYSITIA